MEEFDIIITPNYTYWMHARPPSNGQRDFWSRVAHEIGHGLGIDHVTRHPAMPDYIQQQIMYYTVPDGNTGDISHRYMGGSDYRALCTLDGC
jgi:hypothetical protein